MGWENGVSLLHDVIWLCCRRHLILLWGSTATTILLVPVLPFLDDHKHDRDEDGELARHQHSIRQIDNVDNVGGHQRIEGVHASAAVACRAARRRQVDIRCEVTAFEEPGEHGVRLTVGVQVGLREVVARGRVELTD